MPSEPWTIDSIAHALPHPQTRQAFLSEVNLAPVDQLPAVLDKWVRFLDRWQNETVPKIEELRQYVAEHDGHLPPEYEEESAEGRAWYEEWKAKMDAIARPERGAA